MLQTHRQTSLADRARFVWLWESGLPAQIIALQAGVNVSTVYRWINRSQKNCPTRTNTCTSFLKSRMIRYLVTDYLLKLKVLRDNYDQYPVGNNYQSENNPLHSIREQSGLVRENVAEQESLTRLSQFQPSSDINTLQRNWNAIW